MNSRKDPPAIAFLAGLSLGLLLFEASCRAPSGGEAGKKEEPAPASASESGRPTVTLDEASMKAAGIETAVLKAFSQKAQAEAYGSVLQPESLAETRTRLAAAAGDLAAAQAALDAARKQFDRTSALHADERQASDKALEAARSELASAEALARTRAAVLDAERDRASSQWGGALASVLEKGDEAYRRVADGRDRILEVSVRPGQGISSPPGSAWVSASPGRFLPASLLGPAQRTDARFQGPAYFYRLPAPQEGLLPGMTVEVRLPSGDARPGVVVPAPAVVWLDGRAWVYRQEAPGRYARVAVNLAEPAEGGAWFAFGGLSPGESLVVQGAQALLSQESKGQLQGDE